MVRTMSGSGADIVELGIPFSDPLADGVTIQVASRHALEMGTTVDVCLEVVHRLRQQAVDTPTVLMGYFNPILAYGCAHSYARALTQA
jgi:tryptophan synthase alpha chain